MAEIKEFTCIVCPRGCHIVVDENGNITGNSCPRGLQYVKNEMTCPMRMLTSTVRVESSTYARCPVISTSELPKDKVQAAVRALDSVCIKAPVKIGEIVVKDILGTGVDIVTTRSIER